MGALPQEHSTASIGVARYIAGCWRSLRRTIVFVALVCGAVPMRAQPRPSPLDRAHAHNDYVHARPLHDALDRGFGSVEVDVWLVNGALLVAHDRDSVAAEGTLERLYLDPLRARAIATGGAVHPGRPPLTLLIDIKSHADSTWVVLAPLLARYDDVLTSWRGDSVTTRPVVAVLSGKRPIAALASKTPRWAAIDGRLDDLTRRHRVPARVMPLISDNWEKITKWRGEGAVPAAVKQRVLHMASRAHAEGKRLRFWNTPDSPTVWQLLLDAGVDLIGTDDLDALSAFLSTQR